MKLVEYAVIENQSLHNLVDGVNKAIEDGWTPQGQMIPIVRDNSVYSGSHSGGLQTFTPMYKYAQTMVRHEAEEHEKPKPERSL